MKKIISFLLALTLVLTCTLAGIPFEAAAANAERSFSIPDPVLPDLIQPEPTPGPITWTNSTADPKPTDAYVYIKANAAYSGRFDQCSFYLYDAGGKLVAQKDEAASASNYLEIWYNITEEIGVVLTPGKTYHYQFQVWFNGVGYKSELLSFTTPQPAPIAPDLIPGAITWTNSVAEPKPTDAYVYIKANAAYSGRFDQCRIALYDADGLQIAEKTEGASASNYLEIWYNITEELGVTLTPCRTYRYQFQVWFDGIEYKSDMLSFTTPLPDSIAPDLIPDAITWTGAVAEPKDSDAYVYIKANAAYSGTFDQAGIKVYDSNGKVVAEKTENVKASNYLEIWYNITEETGAVLMPGKTYKYQYFVRFDGYVYKSDMLSFTTTMPGSTLPDIIPGPIIWSEVSASHTDNEITLRAQVNASSTGLFQMFGIVIKDASGNEVYYNATDISYTGNEQLYEHRFSRCSDEILKPNSTYTYYHMVKFEGTVYASEIYTYNKGDNAPHSYSWTVTREATCHDEGSKTGTCIYCGSTQTQVIPKTAHNLTQFRVEAPSCSQQSYTTQTCTDCSYTETIYFDTVCPSAHFADAPANTNWAHAGIDYAVTNGLFNGITDTTFDPSGDTTRAMLVTVLWRSAGQPQQGTNPFSDVPSGKWYTSAIAWANANGVVNGVGDGKFDPTGNITRQQLATILFRYSQAKGLDTGARASLNSFPDHTQVSGYAYEAMQWAVAEGLINGSNGNLLPKGNATRAQVATILMRYLTGIAQ